MRLPLSIQSWNGKSKEFTIEQLINFYVEVGPATAKSPAVLLNRPMLSDFLTVGSGPIRGWILMAGDLYVVSAREVFKITPALVSTLLGTITGSGPSGSSGVAGGIPENFLAIYPSPYYSSRDMRGD